MINAADGSSEFHYRHRTGGLRGIKGVLYRMGFELAVRRVLPNEYGGMTLPTTTCAGTYLGCGQRDRQSLASLCDQVRRDVAARVDEDCDRRTRISKLFFYTVLVDSPPGIPAVARRLELGRRYFIPDECRVQHFWYERCLMVSLISDEVQVRWDLLYGMCQARLAEAFGITWDLGWAVDSYCRYVANTLILGRFAIDSSAMAHSESALRAGEAMPLSELVRCEVAPEHHLGPRAYHELGLLFVTYLSQISATLPECWAAFRRFLLSRTMNPDLLIQELETASGRSLSEFEAQFVDWIHRRGLQRTNDVCVE